MYEMIRKSGDDKILCVPATVDIATELACLVNSAYRGESSLKGWTSEAKLIGGQRTDAEMIKKMIVAPASIVLVAKAASSVKSILGCVHVESIKGGQCYLGMLTVETTLQNRGIGDHLMRASELFARQEFSATLMFMTVLEIRSELVAWYERRGYKKTGEKKPFPYDDARFGRPLVPDLQFHILAKDL